jgi:hypothetical protein
MTASFIGIVEARRAGQPPKSDWPDLNGPANLSGELESFEGSSGYCRVSVTVEVCVTVPLVAVTVMV